MRDSQIRFTSFQDLDFVFEINSVRKQISHTIDQDVFDFCMSFQRVKWLESMGSDTISKLILNQSAKLIEDEHMKGLENRQSSRLNTSCLSDFKHQKVRMRSGNKFERQTFESTLTKQINSLRHEIVSSFTRIQTELDKSTDKSLDFQPFKSINRQKFKHEKSVQSYHNKSLEKSSRSKQNNSLKSSIILTSRTHRSSLRDSNIVGSNRKPISKMTIPQKQFKQNELEPVSIKVSLKKLSELAPSNSKVLKQSKQSKYHIANKQNSKQVKQFKLNK